MKLVGNVRQVTSTVAKRTGDVIEEKRGYKLDVRPAGIRTGFDYGYGDFSFCAHGVEMDALDIALGDMVDVFIVKKGSPFEGRETDDLRFELQTSKTTISNLIIERDRYADQSSRYCKDLDAGRRQVEAYQAESIRLLTELTTLKTMLQTGGLPPMLSADAKS